MKKAIIVVSVLLVISLSLCITGIIKNYQIEKLLSILDEESEYTLDDFIEAEEVDYSLIDNFRVNLKSIKEYSDSLYLDYDTNEIVLAKNTSNGVDYSVIGKDGELFKTPTKKTSSKNSNYKVSIDKKKINVKYNNNSIVDSIEYVKSGYETDKNKPEIGTNMVFDIDDTLVLINSSYYWDYKLSDLEWDEASAYSINKNGIVKEFKGLLLPLDRYDDKVKYFYHINLDNKEVQIYDKNLKNIYKYNYKGEVDANSINYTCFDTIKPNYCLINNKYIDISTQQETNFKEAYYKKLDDRYGFTLKGYDLVIYDKGNAIGHFDSMEEYLGGYYFRRSDFITQELVQLEIKDSTN